MIRRCPQFLLCRLLVLLLVLLLVGGCQKKEPATPDGGSTAGGSTAGQTAGQAPAVEPAAPRIVKEEGPRPTPDTTIASAGGQVVTVGDFERSARTSLLFAPPGQTELPPERLAIPHVHFTMTRALLSQKLIAEEATKRGIEITDEDLEEWLLQHDRLDRFGEMWGEPEKLSAALAEIGLELEDLRRVARAELQKKRLTEELLKEVDDEEIWSAYEQQMTTRTIALVTADNVPTSDEIDEWMGDHPDEIEEYFAKNQKRFRTPKRVKLQIVRPAPGERVSDEKLKKAAALLEEGVQPVTIAKKLGLEFELDAELVRGENPEAFAMKPPEVGWTADGPRGAYAWKVAGFESSRPAELSRSLRREISAEILRTKELVPSVRRHLERAADILRKTDLEPHDEGGIDALEREIESIDRLEFSITTFANNPMGSIPTLGLAEEIVEAAFAPDVDEGDVVGPALSRERGFVFEVLDTHTATPGEFREKLEENRKAYIDALRPRVVQMWVEEQMQELDANVDVKPLRIEFGVLQKE